MLLGYNTNGFAHHEPIAALEVLAEFGYQSVALTIDHGCANPYAADFERQVERIAAALERLKLRSVVETGARFLLDSRTKHEPTLLSAAAERRAARVDFLRRSIDVARRLGSDCVSLWSGILRDGVDEATAWQRLDDGLRRVLDHATLRDVVIGFEPEPGMFIDTMTRFDELSAQLDSPLFQLTLDIGHLHCLGETPLADYVSRYSRRIVNIHIEDMRAGVHDHLMFGEGEIDFPPVLAALASAGYRGGLHVELSRHSHDAPSAARRAAEFLSPLLRETSRRQQVLNLE